MNTIMNAGQEEKEKQKKGGTEFSEFSKSEVIRLGEKSTQKSVPKQNEKQKGQLKMKIKYEKKKNRNKTYKNNNNETN